MKPSSMEKLKTASSGEEECDVAHHQPEPKMFKFPVDSEGKSKKLVLWSLSHPHHTAFHLSWIAVSFACEQRASRLWLFASVAIVWCVGPRSAHFSQFHATCDTLDP